MTTPREHIGADWWPDWLAAPENQPQKVNVQTLAKTPILMDAIVAPRGHKFVSMDFTSLENVVLAYLSGDPNLKEIYASGKPHDGYLYVACKILDETGELGAVYNIDNPTRESVGAAKKQFKSLRTVAKVVTLMSTYKASPGAIQRKLGLFGINQTKRQVVDLHERYWGPELFETVLAYEQDLLHQVDQNDGFLYNEFGRPLVVTERKRKDILNTMCQSTGHDCLDILLSIVQRRVDDHPLGHTWRPVLPDYHDETIWLASEETSQQLANEFTNSMAELNDTLGWSIKLTGDPEITDNFTQFKNPDVDDNYEDWLIMNTKDYED
jgi:hypothetical protein